jgi:hypothetical protein
MRREKRRSETEAKYFRQRERLRAKRRKNSVPSRSGGELRSAMEFVASGTSHEGDERSRPAGANEGMERQAGRSLMRVRWLQMI